MIEEHDCVVLTQNIPEAGLEAGDIGTVIRIHDGGAGYDVELMTLAAPWLAAPAASGRSLVVPPLFPLFPLFPLVAEAASHGPGKRSRWLRCCRDIAHVRELTAA